MSFWGRNFVFNNIPSENFSLIISSTDSGEGSSAGSVDVDIKTQELFRRPIPFFYGVQQSPVMEFDVSFRTTETEITSEDSAIIQKWLFGQMGYKKLRIVQEDMEDYYFNCFLVSPKIVRVGNIIRGFDCTVKCDSPYAWGMTKSVTYTQSNKTYKLYNESDNLFYTYPTLIINANGMNGDFYIKNITDNNRIFYITNLTSQSLVTVNNDLQIITSTTDTNMLNKLGSTTFPSINNPTPAQFFRLVSGVNELYVLGHIHNIIISYTVLKRMG